MTVARGGRLSADTSAAMQALNTSVEVDKRLWREDIQGSIAHAHGLAKAGVISEADAKALQWIPRLLPSRMGEILALADRPGR